MFFLDGRGRAFKLTLPAVVLVAAACASGVPLGSPVFPPVPAAEARPDLQKKEAPRAKGAPRSKEAPRSEEAPRSKQRPRPAAPKRARPPAVRIDSAAMELAVTKQHAHGPLALALARRTQNPEMADRAASAVVREAERLRLSPSLLAAVLLIENAPLDSIAVSREGAIGMMQIMPVHLGSFGCERDLVNVESNICHGARLLKHLVRRTGSVPVALRRYNGCVRGRNTPRCYRYPTRVLRTASRLRREVLVNAGLADMTPEILAGRSQAEAVSIPSQPIAGSDSARTPGGSPTAQCASFMGCLRYRWTLTY